MTAAVKFACRSQAGTTLTEVLVTIVVISFGLLGVAALQAVSLKNNKSALFRNHASMMAHDMIDRMRVNRKQTKDGSYDTGGAPIAWTGSAISPEFTSTGMAKTDVTDWIKGVSKRLPAGKAKIKAAASANVIQITIQWDDSRGTGGSTQEFSFETQGCGSDANCYL